MAAEESVQCNDCSEELPLLKKFKCSSCSATALCGTCVLLHCKKSHTVLDIRDNPPELCDTHKQLYTYFCRNCTACLCLQCIKQHMNHRVIDIEDKATEGRKKVHEALGQEELFLKDVLKRKDDLVQLSERTPQPLIGEEAESFIESIVDLVRKQLQKSLAQNNQKILKSREKVNKKVRRIDRYAENCYERTSLYRSMLSLASKALIETTERMQSFNYGNFYKNDLTVVSGERKLGFDYTVFGTKVERLISRCLKLPSFPQYRSILSAGLIEQRLHNTKVKTKHGLAAVSMKNLVSQDPEKPNFLNVLSLTCHRLKQKEIPTKLRAHGRLKALVCHPSGDFLVGQFGNSLFRTTSFVTFCPIPLAQVKPEETLLCVTKHFVLLLENKNKIKLCKQWTMKTLETNVNKTLITPVMCKTSPSGICGFNTSKGIYFRHPQFCVSPNVSNADDTLRKMYHTIHDSLVDIQLPYLCFCFIEYKGRLYTALHGRSPGLHPELELVVLSRRALYGTSMSELVVYRKVESEPIIFLEFLPETGQLLCVHQSGSISLKDVPFI